LDELDTVKTQIQQLASRLGNARQLKKLAKAMEMQQKQFMQGNEENF
jgi:hypothetical protein